MADENNKQQDEFFVTRYLKGIISGRAAKQFAEAIARITKSKTLWPDAITVTQYVDHIVYDVTFAGKTQRKTWKCGPDQQRGVRKVIRENMVRGTYHFVTPDVPDADNEE